MSDCLVYWKTYWDDPNKLDRDEVITWHTKDTSFFQKINLGDCIWVVISGGHQFPEEWRLLAKITIERLEIEETEYGPYTALGDRDQSVQYDIRNQPNFESILKTLHFQSNKQIQASGRQIGNSLQAIRPLCEQDIKILHSYSNQLGVVLGKSKTELRSPNNLGPSQISRKIVTNTNFDVQVALFKKQIASIQQYLNGKVTLEISNEKLCDWVNFCYQFELYKEGRDLFTYIMREDINPWYYEKTKKIARLCELKASNDFIDKKEQ